MRQPQHSSHWITSVKTVHLTWKEGCRRIVKQVSVKIYQNIFNFLSLLFLWMHVYAVFNTTVFSRAYLKKITGTVTPLSETINLIMYELLVSLNNSDSYVALLIWEQSVLWWAILACTIGMVSTHKGTRIYIVSVRVVYKAHEEKKACVYHHEKIKITQSKSKQSSRASKNILGGGATCP